MHTRGRPARLGGGRGRDPALQQSVVEPASPQRYALPGRHGALRRTQPRHAGAGQPGGLAHRPEQRGAVEQHRRRKGQTLNPGSVARRAAVVQPQTPAHARQHPLPERLHRGNGIRVPRGERAQHAYRVRRHRGRVEPAGPSPGGRRRVGRRRRRQAAASLHPGTAARRGPVVALLPPNRSGARPCRRRAGQRGEPPLPGRAKLLHGPRGGGAQRYTAGARPRPQDGFRAGAQGRHRGGAKPQGRGHGGRPAGSRPEPGQDGDVDRAVLCAAGRFPDSAGARQSARGGESAAAGRPGLGTPG